MPKLVNVVFMHMRRFPVESLILLGSFGILSLIELFTWILLLTPHYERFIMYYCLLYACNLLWDRYVVFHNKLMLKEKVKYSFIKSGWQKYNDLSSQDKTTISELEYESKLNDASDSIVLIIDWGLHEIVVIIKMLVILLYISGEYISLLIMIVNSWTIYKLFFEKAECVFREKYKRFEKNKLLRRKELLDKEYIFYYGGIQMSKI